MTPTAWAHLPNAKHIDRVIMSVTHNFHMWGPASAAWDARNDVLWRLARGDTWDALISLARDEVWSAALSAVWDAANGTARYPAWEGAWSAANDAIFAFVAHDDCVYLLNEDVGYVRLLAELGVDQAILLRPVCEIFSLEKEII